MEGIKDRGIVAFLKRKENLSKIATLSIFLAMIRCTIEAVRLGIKDETKFENQIVVFIIGAVISMFSVLILLFLHHRSKFNAVFVGCALTIMILILLKAFYL